MRLHSSSFSASQTIIDAMQGPGPGRPGFGYTTAYCHHQGNSRKFVEWFPE